jgi:DNA-binding CsgD family transcriptional regulator
MRTVRRRKTIKEIARFRPIVGEKERTGDFAYENHLYRAAAEQYKKALSTGTIGLDDRFRITEKLIRSFLLSDDPQAANPWIEQMLDVYAKRPENAAKAIEMSLQMNQLLWLDAQTKQCLIVGKQAVRIAEATGDPHLLKIAYRSLAMVLNMLGRFDESERALNAIGNVDSSDGPQFLIRYYSTRAYTLATCGKAAECYEDFEHVIAIAKKSADPVTVITAWTNYAIDATILGDIKRAKTSLEQALLIARRYHIGWFIPSIGLQYADLLANMGAYETACTYLHEALASEAHIPMLDERFVSIGIPLALRMRDEATLARCIRPKAIESAFQSGEPGRIFGVAAAYAQLHARRGERLKARALLGRALSRAHYIGGTLDFSLEVARHSERADIARTRALLKKRIELPSSNLARAYLVFFDALVEQRYGTQPRLRSLASEAVERFKALHWYGHAEQAQMLLPGVSDPSIALAKHERPFADLQSILTEREREVAALALEGLTNRAIAERLSVREHTVEKHMSAILKALEIHSRHQLVDILRMPEKAEDIPDSGMYGGGTFR